MKVLLVGSGAVGAFYASKIDQYKHSVSAICRSNYDAVNKNGFTIHSQGDSYNWRPADVFSSVEDVQGHYDLIIIATKADQFINLKGFVSAMPTILLLQNGIGIEDKYAQIYPQLAIMSAVTLISCAQTSAGVISHYS